MGFTDKFFGDHVQYLTTALDAIGQRQEFLANNIANASTPNYVAKDLDFDDQFRQILAEKFGEEPQSEIALFGSEPGHIVPDKAILASFTPNVMEQGGSVDINHEMVKLAQNQLLFNTIADQTMGFFTVGCKYIIEGFGK